MALDLNPRAVLVKTDPGVALEVVKPMRHPTEIKTGRNAFAGMIPPVFAVGSGDQMRPTKAPAFEPKGVLRGHTRKGFRFENRAFIRFRCAGSPDERSVAAGVAAARTTTGAVPGKHHL